MIGGKIIKDLKLAYNDIFGKNAKNYWKDEGNNKRMQSYYKFANILGKAKTVITLLFVMFITYQISKVITDLINGFDICSMTNCMEVAKSDIANNILIEIPMMIIMMGILLLGFCLKGFIKAKNYTNIVLLLIIIAPIMYLLKFGINYNMINSIIFFIILMLYISISFLINWIYGSIIDLYDVAVGKIELNDVKDENKKKERKRK